MGKGAIYVANESGSTEIKGQAYYFTKGVTRVREGHILLKTLPHLFNPIEDHVDYEVEQATKAPGEKRKTTAKAKP